MGNEGEMPKIAVVTDSTSCIPQELIKEYNIKAVPFHIHFEDKVYSDDTDLKSTDFYKMQKEAKESGKNIPTTASATTAG
jgi:fatty acid-binding protein DegV